MSFCLYNKKNITWRLEDMNFIFSWPPCNIHYIFLYLLYGPNKLQQIKTAVTPLKYSKISILTIANSEKKVLSSREEQGLKKIKKNSLYNLSIYYSTIL